MVGLSDFLRNLSFGSEINENVLEFRKKAFRFADCEALIYDYPSGIFYTSCSFTITQIIKSAKISYVMPQERVITMKEKKKLLHLNTKYTNRVLSLIGHVDILYTLDEFGQAFSSGSS